MADRVLHITRDDSASTHDEARFRISGESSRESRNIRGLKQYLRESGVPERQIDHAIADLAESGNAEVEFALRPRVGPKIVRAWFDTIINPLIDAVEREAVLVDNEDWRWRFRPNGLESMCPARQYLGQRTWANLEQLSELYPELEAAIRQHDESEAQLERAVGVLYESIVRDDGFRALCDRLLSPEALAEIGIANPTELFGAYPPDDWLGLLAQYTVNNTALLGPHNATARLWNRRRKEFLSVLDSPGIIEPYRVVSEAARELLEADSRLLEIMKELRRVKSHLNTTSPTSWPARIEPSRDMIMKAVIDSGPLFSALVLHYASREPTRINRDLCMRAIPGWPTVRLDRSSS